MNIQGLKAYQQQIKSISGIDDKIKNIEPNATEGKEDFVSFLKTAVKDVDRLQYEADDQIEGLATNRPGVTSHDAMIALEKADIAFQMMNTIRGKIVRAYEEVLRTQI
ncbi:MAG: flagellar hook-basal body complex protein FliE [Deltaproteobacteria bacterium]|nr:flagellar hook-basal body complex protein FliE [Deltaproteobacteria bacterium]